MATHIKNIISEVITQEENWQLNLITHWSDIIGDLKAHASLEIISKTGTIVIGVDNSSWMHELSMLSNILIKKINKYLKQDVIKKIRFKLTEKNNQKIRKKIKEVKKFELKKIELNARQERALTKIKDPELNEQLVKFLQKCQNYGK